MKKINFNKNRKILLIITLNIIIVNCAYTYQDYQNTKDMPEHQLIGKNTVQNINNELGLYALPFNEAVKNNITRFSNNSYIAFDNSLTPFYNSDFRLCYFNYVTRNADNSVNINDNYRVNLNNVNYQTLKEISAHIINLAEDKEKVIATFNYDAIRDNDVIFVNEITYFAIGDNVFIDENNDNVVSKEIRSFITPFGYYENTEDGSYYDTHTSSNYDDLEKSLAEIVKSDKFDNNGYYEIVNPVINENYKSSVHTDENSQVKMDIKACFQKIDPKYSIYDHRTIEGIYDSSNIENGYIAWYEFYIKDELYTFKTYLLAHYANYILSLLLIIGSYFLVCVINKKSGRSPINEPMIKKQPMVKREITNKEAVDIEKQLTDLINISQNLLTFKNVSLEYYPNSLTVSGNKIALTKVINDIFHFVLRHTTLNNKINIKIENQQIYFINNNNSITNKELEEINEVIEIIEAHNFKFHFNLDNNCYQIIIDTANTNTD